MDGWMDGASVDCLMDGLFVPKGQGRRCSSQCHVRATLNVMVVVSRACGNWSADQFPWPLASQNNDLMQCERSDSSAQPRVQPCRGQHTMHVEVGPSAETCQTNELEVDKKLQVQNQPSSRAIAHCKSLFEVRLLG
jgi:hypothetical protein